MEDKQGESKYVQIYITLITAAVEIFCIFPNSPATITKETFFFTIPSLQQEYISCIIFYPLLVTIAVTNQEKKLAIFMQAAIVTCNGPILSIYQNAVNPREQ